MEELNIFGKQQELGNSLFAKTEQLNKKQIAKMATEIGSELVENGEDLARVYAIFAKNIEMMQGIMEAIKPTLTNQISLGGMVVGGCKLEQHNTTRYDYSNTQVWCETKEATARLDEKRKLIEKTAKTLDRFKGGAEWVDGETGEVFQIYPAIPSTTETVKCTIL